MARVLLSVYSLIVLISLVHHPVSSTTTVASSPATTIQESNPTASPNATNYASVNPSSTASPNATNYASVYPSSTVSTPGGNGMTSLNTLQIAPTTSGNVPVSSSVPSAQPTKYEARVTVDANYEPEYKNISSQTSKQFINSFTSNVTPVLNGRLSGNITIKVTNLSNGSVVVDFDVIAMESSNASVENIKAVLEYANRTNSLGYKLIGEIIVRESQNPSATVSATAIVSPSKSAPVTKPTTAPPTCATKGTEIWDKAIDLATPMGTFIIVVVAVALILVLLIALICVCCKYRNLKKRTHFPDHMAINDSEWIRSSDDLLMWERNLRASEVKTTNGISNRPINDKRT